MRWVLLLNYNTAGLCLQHLARFAQVDDLGVVIVDNCSGVDDRSQLEVGVRQASGEIVSADDPEVEARLRAAMLAGARTVLLRCAVNLGYGGGNNMGLRLATSTTTLVWSYSI